MGFAKGQSGNPKGRPKQTVEEKAEKELFKSLLKSSTVAALQSLIEIASSKCHKDRFNACKYLIDRAYGSNAALLLEDTDQSEPVVITVVPFRQDDEDDDWE